MAGNENIQSMLKNYKKFRYQGDDLPVPEYWEEPRPYWEERCPYCEPEYCPHCGRPLIPPQPRIWM